MRDIRIAVYGDVNLNIIDGSAIWLQSVATALASQPRNDVTVVLKAREQRDLLTRPLRNLPGVKVVNPVELGWASGPELSRNQAIDALERLDEEAPFDVVILRGLLLCHGAATRKNRRFVGRLWPYLTDIPQHAQDLDAESLARIAPVIEASRYVLCQTEALRSYLESNVPGVAEKAVLLSPMIPDQVPARAPTPTALAADEPLRLIYVGKYAPMWNTYEMTVVAAKLRNRGVPVELHMVGDKIHQVRTEPDYYPRMERALKTTPGVHWHAGKSRDETLAALTEHHVALGWRAPGLDESLELSTKLLEYGAVGIPALVNRTVMHEELLGADYPLFASSEEDFELAIIAARDPEVRRLAAERCAQAAQPFTFSAVARSLQPFLDRTVPRRDLRGRARPLRILTVSHDFKFFTRIGERLAAIRGAELRVDAWREIDAHDPVRSQELLEWADVIVCEWATNNAIWYSKRKKPHQKLIVRLHRFELYRRYPAQIAFDQVDHMVFVGDYYRDEALTKLGWARDKLSVIPNWVDTRMLDRPKVYNALFNLGMIGIAPKRKRLDRGLNVLERLRRYDDRFQMYVKTKLPWEYPWIWKERDEREHYEEIFRRTQASAALRGAVHYDSFGPEVAPWLRKVGFVLSTSDDESFHLAPAEGMASGAVPMLLPWQGADRIYPSEHVYADEEAMTNAILEMVEDGSWEERGGRAKEYIEQNYSVERVCDAWESLVVG